MKKLSDFIIKKRNLILLVAVLLLIPSIIEYAYTKINYDLLSYLPQDTESMTGQKSLSDDFNLANTGMLVTGNMPDKSILELKKGIKVVNGVKDVLWGDGVLDISTPKEILPKDVREMLYSSKRTLMVTIFQEETSSQRTMDAIKTIKDYIDRGYYLGGFSTITGDIKDLMNEEAPLYAVTAIILYIIVLSMGLGSSTAPFVFVPGIVFPVAYNFGTNVFLGQISCITKALALILQLGVMADYSVFLLHHYQEEKKKGSDRDEAMLSAIQAAPASITSSSIAAIAGFLALCTVQLTLGRDIDIVMAKGVVFGVLSTIIILPALLMLFDKYIEKWKHPILLKEPRKLPGFLTRHYRTVLMAFVVIFIPMIYAQAHTSVCYNLDATMPEDFPNVISMNKLKDRFHMMTMHSLLVDKKLENYKIKRICDSVEELPGIYSIVSYESLIDSSIPNGLEPAAVKNILQNDGKKMILVNSTYRSATSEEDRQLNKVDTILHKYDRHTVVAREDSLAYDLIIATDIGFRMVNILSVAAIFLIIAITFKSLVLPVILATSIEFAICISMGTPFFVGTALPFIASIVIGTVQLGATVDYAILITTRYREELSDSSTVIETAREATAKSVPSIITSGLSFFAACISVSFVSEMDLIKSLCTLISREAVIPVLSVLLVPPAMLIIFRELIEKITKGWPRTNLK